MTNFIAGSLNGHFPAPKDGLEVLSILLNNSCNLGCRHCYLQASKFDDYLTPSEWIKFFSSVLTELEPSTLCFAGKEVFIDDDSVSVLLDTVRLRDRLQSTDKKTQIGVITNGTLLHRYRDKLKDCLPDYWDISIDGRPQYHDLIRGSGVFKQLAPNLEWLISDNVRPVWITHTVFESNLLSLPEFIRFYHLHYNVQNFSIGFYKPLEHTDPSLTLRTADYYALTDRVFPELEKLTLSTAVNVNMEFDSSQSEMIDVLTAKGWADPVEPIASVSHTYDNGLALRINTVRVPVGLWRSTRVTPEGYWLAAEDLMRVKEYDKVAVAKVRDYDYDALRLYRAGLRHRKARIDVLTET